MITPGGRRAFAREPRLRCRSSLACRCRDRADPGVLLEEPNRFETVSGLGDNGQVLPLRPGSRRPRRTMPWSSASNTRKGDLRPFDWQGQTDRDRRPSPVRASTVITPFSSLTRSSIPRRPRPSCDVPDRSRFRHRHGHLQLIAGPGHRDLTWPASRAGRNSSALPESIDRHTFDNGRAMRRGRRRHSSRRPPHTVG